jgi:LCP family protein required for cell wall assembly
VSDQPTEPQRRRGVHLDLRRSLLALSATVATVIAVVAASGFGFYQYANRARRTIPPPPPSGPQASPQIDISGKCAEHVCNYLLLGSDSRSGLTKKQQQYTGTNADIGNSFRSDVIVVAHVEPDQKRVTFLSFPRDLWVNVPGMGYDKINAAFEGGIKGVGPYRVARTIKAVSGIQIDHLLYVNLAGFEDVVQAMGGVDMCVPYPMQDQLTGLNIQAGCQHFDGSTALAYVRTRHQPCDAIPDFARIARQQQFLRAVIAKLLSPGEVLHLPQLVRPVLNAMWVDPGLNIAELAYLAGELRGVSTGNADFRVVPSTPGWETLDGVPVSVVHLVEPQANQLFQALDHNRPLGALGLTSPSTPPSPAVIRTAVYERGVKTAPSSSPSTSVSPSAGASPSPSASAATGTPSPSTTPVAKTPGQLVYDHLTAGGFDTSTPLQPTAALGASHLPKGSVILYDARAADGQAMADVVQGYLSNMSIAPAPKHVLPSGVAIAVLVSPKYMLPPPATAPPTNCANA